MLYTKFYDCYKSNYKLTSFFRKLENNSQIYLMGGLLREYYCNNLRQAPRDIDVIIKKNNYFDILKTLEVYINSYSINQYGGYKFIIDNISIDLWELDNTWAFKKRLLQSSVDNLQKSVYLNIDSPVYDFKNNKWYNDSILKSIARNKEFELNVVLDQNPNVKLNLLRAINFKNKYNVKFSENLLNLLYEYFSKDVDFLDSMMELQYKHYKTEMLTKKQLTYEIDCLLRKK